MAAFRPDRLSALAAAELEHPWFVARRSMIEGLVARHRPKGPGIVVDVGGGTGRTLAAVSGPDDRVLSVDLLTGHEEQARNGVDLVVADATALPLRAQSADVVLCCDVLEHVVDHAGAAAEIARVLATPGVAILTVPAHAWLWSFRDIDAGHVRRYTRSELEAILQVMGLRVVQSSWFAGSTLPLLASSRLIGRRWASTRDKEDRVRDGAVGRLIGSALAAEAQSIMRGRGLPFGSSLVAVVRRA